MFMHTVRVKITTVKNYHGENYHGENYHHFLQFAILVFCPEPLAIRFSSHLFDGASRCATRSARQLGSGFKAAKQYNKRHAEEQDFAPIPDDTAQCWYKHWKKTGANKKRGCKEIITPSEKEEINLAFDLLRAPKQGESVSAREYGSITRGIVEKHRPAILTAHGGPGNN